MFDWLSSRHITLFTDIPHFHLHILERKLFLKKHYSNFRFYHNKALTFLNTKQVFKVFQNNLSTPDTIPDITPLKRKCEFSERTTCYSKPDLDDLTDSLNSLGISINSKIPKVRNLPFHSLDTFMNLLSLDSDSDSYSDSSIEF